MVCATCGTVNPDPARFCLRCGAPQAAVTATSATPTEPDTGVTRVIPYRNAQALIAYYCGVFALIPCVGVPLAVAAVVLGILGRSYASAHPEAHGSAHAWAGILLGALVLVAHAAGAVYLATR